jgi:hypothetical protein
MEKEGFFMPHLLTMPRAMRTPNYLNFSAMDCTIQQDLSLVMTFLWDFLNRQKFSI